MRAVNGVAAGIAICVSLLASASHAQQAQEARLYGRLGGKPAITAVVDDFVGNVAADSRINGFFARRTYRV
jgi:hemoglobin